MFSFRVNNGSTPYAQILTTAAHYSFVVSPVYSVQNAAGTVESKEGDPLNLKSDYPRTLSDEIEKQSITLKGKISER